MKSSLIAAIALIVLGAAVLGYDHFTFTTKEQVVKIGPLEATAERKRTVSFPPLLGWMLVAGGVCMLILARSRKD